MKKYTRICKLVMLSTINNTYDEKLSYISLSYQFDVLDDVNKRLHELSFTYDNGKVDLGVDPGQKENFHIATIDYTLLSFVKVPFFDSSSRVILRSYTQLSGTHLSSIARFSLTGPTKVRGFSPSYFTADNAAYLGADWIFNSPDLLDFSLVGVDFTNVFKPFVFADYAFGYQHLLGQQEGEPEYATAQLADIGFGVKVAHNSGFNGNMQLAFPVLSELKMAGEDPTHDSLRLTFNFQYAF